MASGFNKGFVKGSVALNSGMGVGISRKPFSPHNVSDLVGCWQTNLGIGLSGSDVTAWSNQGSLVGAMTQSVAATRPFYNLSGSTTIYPTISMNGFQYVVCDLLANVWRFLHTGPATVFTAMRVDNANPNSQYCILTTAIKSAAGSVPGINLFIDDRTASGFNNRLGFQVKNNSGAIFDYFGGNDAAGTPTNIQIFQMNVLTGSGVVLTVNGNLPSALASGSFTGSPYWGDPQFSLVFGAGGGTKALEGSFLEVLIYSKSLDTAEQTLVRNYLGLKYSVPGIGL